MNILNRNTSNYLLADAIAENLLETGHSISFEHVNEMEIISAPALHSSEETLLFLPFDPVRTNAADFLEVLLLLELQPKIRMIIVVAEEGERDILLNIIKKQEMKEADVLCLHQLKFYPLQLI